MKQVHKAVIKKDGKFLIVLRSKDDIHFPLYWDFPGGKSDAGEDASHALMREVLEETGLKIKPVKMIWHKDLETYREIVRFFVYTTELKSGEVKLSEEHSDFQWASKDDILSRKIEPYMEMFFKEWFE